MRLVKVEKASWRGLLRRWWVPPEGGASHLFWLAAAVLPGVGHDPAFRLRKDPDPEGYAIESRSAWAAVVGHLAVYDENLIAALSILHSLVTTPESLANLLEAAGAIRKPRGVNPGRR